MNKNHTLFIKNGENEYTKPAQKIAFAGTGSPKKEED